jgi:hypothetical protein
LPDEPLLPSNRHRGSLPSSLQLLKKRFPSLLQTLPLIFGHTNVATQTVTVALPTTTTPNMNTTNSIMFLTRRAFGGHGFTTTINNIRETVTTGSAITRSLGHDEKKKGKSFLGQELRRRGIVLRL